VTLEDEVADENIFQNSADALKDLATILKTLPPASAFHTSGAVHPQNVDVHTRQSAPRMEYALEKPKVKKAQITLANKLRLKGTDDIPGMRALRLRKKLPQIAVIGRPNVGKSAIANRLTSKFHRGSIVWDEPGITRDRTYGDGWWNGYEFSVVDTGGLIFDDIEGEIFLKEIREQAVKAVAESKAVIMVVDGRVGPTGFDLEIGNWLRKQNIPVFLAVNKCESFQLGEAHAMEFYELGMGTPYPVSAIHGTGLAEMLDDVVKVLPPPPKGGYDAEWYQSVANYNETAENDMIPEIKIAIVGKPNTGKSTLLNKMTRSDRAIVSDIPGTTRDALENSIIHQGVKFTFIDTAGIRRKARIGRKNVEEEMVKRALRAARRADVCLLLLDATQERPTDQEHRIGRFIQHAGRACVTIVNKWDAIPNKNDKLYRDSRIIIDSWMPEVAWAKKLFVSAKTGLRTNDIFKAIVEADAQHSRRVKTSVLNEVLEEGVRWQKPPSNTRGQIGNIYFGAQVGTKPPAFVLFCNNPTLFNNNYRKYLARHIRKSFGFEGSSLNIYYKRSKARRTPGVPQR